MSSSKSLAALETLVHLSRPATAKYVIIPIQFDDAMAELLPLKRLLTGWNIEPPPPASQQIGDEWLKAARSAILALPSIITGDLNFLLNPAHAEFNKIKLGNPEPPAFDFRLIRTR